MSNIFVALRRLIFVFHPKMRRLSFRLSSCLKNALKASQKKQEFKVLKSGIVSTALFGLVLSASSVYAQLASPINTLIVNLAKGQVAQSPIRINNGWHVIKLDDVRPFVIAPFEQVRNNLAQELVQQRRQQAVNSLLKDTKIVKGS